MQLSAPTASEQGRGDFAAGCHFLTAVGCAPWSRRVKSDQLLLVCPKLPERAQQLSGVGLPILNSARWACLCFPAEQGPDPYSKKNKTERNISSFAPQGIW